MATSLTLTVGALNRSLTAANDTKAADVLLQYARAIGVPENATNAQRADAILRALANHMLEQARQQRIGELRGTMFSQADEEIQF